MRDRNAALGHHFLSIVRCSDGSLFTCIAEHIETMIKETNAGRGAPYTRGRLPVALVYAEEYMNEKDAGKRQAEIKKLTRAEKERLVASAVDV